MVLGCEAIGQAFLGEYLDLAARSIVAETGNTAVVSDAIPDEMVIQARWRRFGSRWGAVVVDAGVWPGRWRLR